MTGPNKASRDGRLRSSWQVLAVYIGASWVVLQVVDVLKDNMGLPDWVFPFSVVLLLIGLPIMLVTAMIQGRPTAAVPEATDSTPAPVTSQTGSERPSRHLFTWRNALFGGAAAFVLLTAVTTGFMFMRNRGIGQGDLENAAVYYAQFVDLWSEADPDVQPRVETARARLQDIVRERG